MSKSGIKITFRKFVTIYPCRSLADEEEEMGGMVAPCLVLLSSLLITLLKKGQSWLLEAGLSVCGRPSVHVVMFMITLLVLPSVEGGPLDLAPLAVFSRDQEAGAPSVLEGRGVVKVWCLTWRTYLMYQDG